MKRRIIKALAIVGIVITSVIATVLVAHGIGRIINNRTPDDGINESMYVDINGTKQWINIYGEDINNPVLLYLHGGPGSATSCIDYSVTRQWADVYTVVTWDQRNCGKSYNKAYNGTKLTYDLFMEDGKEITEFILDYTGKEKITILGHSWGPSTVLILYWLTRNTMSAISEPVRSLICLRTKYGSRKRQSNGLPEMKKIRRSRSN